LRPLDEVSAKEELEGTDALDEGSTVALLTGFVALLTGVVVLLAGVAALELTFAELESTVAELEGAAAELLAGIVELERGRAADEPATALELAVLMALEQLALTVESLGTVALELFASTSVESFGATLLELLNTFSLVVSAELETLDELDFLRDVEDFELEDCVPSWDGLLVSPELSESAVIALSLEISSFSAKKSISVPLSSVQP
jgi:hypothetical protein